MNLSFQSQGQSPQRQSPFLMSTQFCVFPSPPSVICFHVLAGVTGAALEVNGGEVVEENLPPVPRLLLQLRTPIHQLQAPAKAELAWIAFVFAVLYSHWFRGSQSFPQYFFLQNA